MGIAFTQIVPFVFLPLMTLQNIDFVPTAVLQKKKERKKKKEKKKSWQEVNSSKTHWQTFYTHVSDVLSTS